MLNPLIKRLIVISAVLTAVTHPAVSHATPDSAELVVEKFDAAVLDVNRSFAVYGADPVQRRVDRLAERISTVAGVPLKAVVVNPNATVLSARSVEPATILINVRLVRRLSDDGLAFVLGHEASHLVHHHVLATARYVTAHAKQPVVDLTSLRLAVQPMRSEIEAINKDNEFSADADGRTFADKAGFDGLAGAANCFSMVQADEMHPANGDRLARLVGSKSGQRMSAIPAVIEPNP